MNCHSELNKYFQCPSKSMKIMETKRIGRKEKEYQASCEARYAFENLLWRCAADRKEEADQ